MVSDVEQDDKAFRATIGNEDELFKTTFKDGSPAANVESSLWTVLSHCKTNQDESLHYSVHLAVAQQIRVILKDWREYKVDVGQQFFEGEPLDSFTLGYSTMHKIGHDLGNENSLRYKVAHCFTAEMKIHSQNRDFTQEKLQSIIDGATKAYLEILQDGELEYGEQEATGLMRDPKPEMAKYSAILQYADEPTESELWFAKNKRKAPVSSIDNNEQQASQEPKRVTKKPRKERATTSPGEQQEQQVPPVVTSTPLESPTKDRKGPGNFGHGKPSKWSGDEDAWAKTKLAEQPQLTFQELADLHNAHWQGTVWNDAKNGQVTRGIRTKGAMQERFKTYRQQMRAEAAKDADRDTQTNTKAATEEEGEEDMPMADAEWLDGSSLKKSIRDGEEVEETGQQAYDLNKAEMEDLDDDEDPVGDLEKIVEGGEPSEVDIED